MRIKKNQPRKFPRPGLGLEKGERRRCEMKRISKKWFKRYFGVDPDPEKKYSSIWQTDGGKATRDFERLPEEFEIVYRSSSKTYWGKIRKGGVR